jgi:hypothetical protein
VFSHCSKITRCEKCGIANNPRLQGIIPAKAGKMASILCDLMTSKLLDVAEMFGKIHPHKFAEALAPEMKGSMVGQCKLNSADP